MGGLLANVRPTSGFMSLTQLRSLLMSMTPDTTKGQETRAGQVGPATHWLSTQEKESYTSPGQHNRLTLRAGMDEPTLRTGA